MGPAPEGPSPSCASLPAPMSRRSLRPQLNQIRGWVRQGRTDAWIAHQLDVTVQQIQAFKREQDLETDSGEPGAPAYEEVDLRAEDDAAIAGRKPEHARICDVIEPAEHGTMVRCTTLPTFWNYNSLRVEGPDSGA